MQQRENPSPAAPEEPKASRSEKALLFLVTATVIVLDQLSKMLIEISLPLNHSWAPIESLAPIFRITHVSNTGAAFGLFPSGSNIFVVVAVVVAVVIVIYNFGLPGENRVFRLALGLQLGGALGNLIDRLRIGHVTDFLDFGPWPVFNVADMSIVAGVIVLGYMLIVEQRQEARRRAAQAQAESERALEAGEERSFLWNE